MDEMYADACPRCNSRHPAALEPLPKSYQDNFRVEVERLLESVFAGNPSGNMLAATGKALTERVAQAYTGVTDDFTTPDAAMLVHLIRDTWQLAAAKSYRQLRDLTLALTNENGKLREWSDFKEVAGKICEQYNSTWLQTEYNFAAISAQTAARRTKLEKEADIIPNLQASLAQIGVIFPQNHPYYSGVPRAEIRKSILYLPPENTYQAVKIGGHKVEV
ncbi:MAG: hypothetical protein LBT94_04135, partial [Prevotellaceae bacterium]|nr:hypothetical protein [Prevotellaceae bacterium]